MTNGEEASMVNLETSLEVNDLTIDELEQILKNYKIDMKFLLHKIKN